mmetsp:Transcript_128564/g.181382  ORF Transcript_128564/g.181382 Transcript_128564/m.181382 type:complete len:227 (-) Transcript_128564:411-1091(-)
MPLTPLVSQSLPAEAEVHFLLLKLVQSSHVNEPRTDVELRFTCPIHGSCCGTGLPRLCPRKGRHVDVATEVPWSQLNLRRGRCGWKRGRWSRLLFALLPASFAKLAAALAELPAALAPLGRLLHRHRLQVSCSRRQDLESGETLRWLILEVFGNDVVSRRLGHLGLVVWQRWRLRRWNVGWIPLYSVRWLMPEVVSLVLIRPDGLPTRRKIHRGRRQEIMEGRLRL